MSLALPRVVCAGGVAYENGKLLLIFKHSGYALAKGHQELEDDGQLRATALREFHEETGYAGMVSEYIGSLERQSTEHGGAKVMKQIKMYLMTAQLDPTAQSQEKPIWVAFDEAVNGMCFPEEAAFLVTCRDTICRDILSTDIS